MCLFWLPTPTHIESNVSLLTTNTNTERVQYIPEESEESDAAPTTGDDGVAEVVNAAEHLIRSQQVDLVVNIPAQSSLHPKTNYLIRRTAIDFNVPLVTNMKVFEALCAALYEHRDSHTVPLPVRSIDEYYRLEAGIRIDRWIL